MCKDKKSDISISEIISVLTVCQIKIKRDPKWKNVLFYQLIVFKQQYVDKS